MKKQHEVWMMEFLDNCRQLNRSNHTIINYAADLRKFFNWFEAIFDHQITKADGNTITRYSEFLANGGNLQHKTSKYSGVKHLVLFFSKNRYNISEFSQQPLSVSSRRRHLSAVKNFFEFLKQSYEDRSSLFQKNPVKPKLHAIKLKDIDVNSTKLLSKDDWSKLSELLLGPKERFMIYLLYYGALRLSELAELRVENFNQEHKSISFKRKGGDVHTLKIQQSDTIFEDLEKYLSSRRSDSKFLFPGKISGHITPRALYKQLIKLLMSSGCSNQVTPHSFRKACATNLYEDTKDLLFVRDYLNHSDAKVTQTYIEN